MYCLLCKELYVVASPYIVRNKYENIKCIGIIDNTYIKIHYIIYIVKTIFK